MTTYPTPIGPQNFKRVTVRGRGKAHRAIVSFSERFPRGHLTISCSCPGSMNGRLANRVMVIAEGWEKSNCGN